MCIDFTLQKKAVPYFMVCDGHVWGKCNMHMAQQTCISLVCSQLFPQHDTEEALNYFSSQVASSGITNHISGKLKLLQPTPVEKFDRNETLFVLPNFACDFSTGKHYEIFLF